MSGPKVVRVVTREELIRNCEGALARLDVVIANWVQQGRKHDTVSQAEIDAVANRRRQLSELLKRNRFNDLMREVEKEASFLKGDQRQRLEKSAVAASRRKTAQRRQQDVATALLAELSSVNAQVPPALMRDLKAGSGLERAISKGFALLSESNAEQQQSGMIELARKLRDPDTPQRSLDDWLGEQPPNPDDRMFSRIEAKISELALVDGDAANPFQERLQALQTIASPGRRTLLLDSLALDLTRGLDQRLVLEGRREQLDELTAELKLLRPQRVLAHNLVGQTIELVEATIKEVEEFIALEKRQASAAERRRVVLQELAELGYEVGADLSTALVEQGRVVVQKPSTPGYGVELSAAGDAERMQVRVVAVGDEPQDATRDRDAETTWCGEVDLLKARIAERGGQFTIEKALPVGAIRLKRVEARSASDQRADSKRPLARTLE